MLCKKPFVKNGATFGCQQCLHCRMNRRRIWTHRIMLEACVHQHSCFTTLTYKNKFLPDQLEPEATQLWMKRLRERVQKPIRYYLIGEYGDATLRPHYHAVLFGMHWSEARTWLPLTWRVDGEELGRAAATELTLHRAQYVAGYVTKKLEKLNDPRLDGLYPEFARMSLRPGIGAPSVASIAEALGSRSGQTLVEHKGDVPEVLRHAGRDLPLGRYMRSRLRDAIGLKNASHNPEEVFRRTAEMYNMYKDHILDPANPPVSMFAWQKRREEVKARKMEGKFKVYNQRTGI